MKRAILFDLDGVLIDSMEIHARTWQKAIQTLLKIEISEKHFLINEGKNSKDLLQELIQQYQLDVDNDTWQEVSDYRDQLFLQEFTPRLVDGADNLVKLIARVDYRMGVATGSTRNVTEEVLAKTGIKEYFSTLITSEDVQFSKPHPQPYQILLEQLGTKPAHSLVIENAPLGVESGRAAGLICLAVSTTNPPEILSKASKVFSNLDEIGDFLLRDNNLTSGKGQWGFYDLLMEETYGS
ncbi:MAG: HAD family phosphatase [Anaerolineaceae bacterium]|nr:HAD family phosphatase [Anaerolineaceae bacterium]